MNKKVLEFNQMIQRHINCLSDDNRNIRKKALEEINKNLFGLSQFQLTPEELEFILTNNPFLHSILRIFSDTVEKCRELAISIVNQGLQSIPNPEVLLQHIFPVLVKRLGQSEVTESSEELRLSLVRMIILILHICKNKVAPYTGDLIKILEQTIIDTYPEVKKASCECTSLAATTVSQQFHFQAEVLIKPLLMTITHQHSKIRVVVIETIGMVMQNCDNKLVNDVVSHLAQRLFDPVAAVRLAVVKVVGDWLLNLIDRYSFHHKLIPLLLSGVTDDIEEIKQEAESLWTDVGQKYEMENENELKDKIDFIKPKPDHFPEYVDRPNLGCRQLVYLHYSKILPAIVGDISDWVAATRVKASQLLYVLLMNEEDNVTQHLDKTLEALYKGCMDEDTLVVQYVMKSSKLIGYYVPAHVWCRMVLQNARMCQSSGSLMILAHVILGSVPSQLEQHLSEITNLLLEPGISQVAENKLQSSILMCINSLLNVVGEGCHCISYELLMLLLYLLALHRSSELASMVQESIDELFRIQKMCSRNELMDKHATAIIKQILPSSCDWTQHSPELSLFETFITLAGPSIQPDIDSVMEILKTNLVPSKHHMVRHRFLALLSHLVSNYKELFDSHKERIVDIVEKMILPNCVWSVGRTSEVIRSSAVLCFWVIMSSDLIDQDMLSTLTNANMMIQLKSLLEDDSKTTRLTTCNLLTRIFIIAAKDLSHDNALYNMYPDLLKRLDDSNDEVRIAASETFASYMGCLLPCYDVQMYGAHLEEIYKGLLIHLDDQNPHVQMAVYNTLQESCTLNPDILLKLIDEVKYKHRYSHLCEQLTQYIHSLPKPA